MKKLARIRRTTERHWVGDGFPVRNIFSYNDLAEELSPFLLLDYAGPADFPATCERRGVGAHPHRGFETVTIVYNGEVEHRDSAGGGGSIGPGDVQWMTAASGIVHEEFHGAGYAKRGGPFEMVQLWVNLPRKDKAAPPGYQSITSAQIPRVKLPSEAGELRVIAGRYAESAGPARTFSPMDVWDLRLRAGKRAEFATTAGHTAAIFVLKGKVRIPGADETVGEAELALLERDGDQFTLEGVEDATALLLLGKPLDEPIVASGPFVMNTEAEIRQAYLDFKSGRMGQLKD